MRLADKILTQRLTPLSHLDPMHLSSWPLIQQQMKQLIGTSPVIIADNVAEYLYAVTDQEHWTNDDFPNVAPPFQSYFIEYRRPSMVRSHGALTSPKDLFYQVGVLFEARRMEDMARDSRDKEDSKDQLDLNLARLYASQRDAIDAVIAAHERKEPLALSPIVRQYFRLLIARKALDDAIDLSGLNGMWVVNATAFVQQEPDTGPVGPVLQWRYGIMPDGSFCATPDLFTMDFKIDDPKLRAQRDEELRVLNNLAFVPWLATSFMHCKNVDLIDGPSTGLNRPTLRRHKDWTMRYHLLQIDPMRTVMRQQGEKSDGQGAAVALHQCRGHFKTYRGRGLFGRHVGMFWWDRHIRGNIVDGLIQKDYAIGAKS